MITDYDMAITNYAHKPRLELIKRIAELEAENNRLESRDGKAKIQLSYDSDGYPFNFEDCKVLDFGVCDNIYIVESPLLNKLLSKS